MKEYWLVDPMAETVFVHHREAGRLVLVGTFGRRDALQSPLLPDLNLRLEEVFAS